MTAKAGGDVGPGARSLRARRQRQRGELRGEVLATARAIIASEGVEGLSMRKLAQRLDCAPMSLYSYVRDKHDLLLALAHESFDALARRLAAERAGSPLQALRKLYLAYARFGLDKPDDYRTLFMTPEAQPASERKEPSEIYADNPAFAISLDRVSACVRAGLIEGDAHAVSAMLWTTVHGAVAAILMFPAFPFGDPDTYVARVVDLAIDALCAKLNEPLSYAVDRQE